MKMGDSADVRALIDLLLYRYRSGPIRSDGHIVLSPSEQESICRHLSDYADLLSQQRRRQGAERKAVMTDEEKWDAYRKAVSELVESFETQFPDARKRALNEMLYSCSELGVWYAGFDKLTERDAIQIWAVVEYARTNGFPAELRM